MVHFLVVVNYSNGLFTDDKVLFFTNCINRQDLSAINETTMIRYPAVLPVHIVIVMISVPHKPLLIHLWQRAIGVMLKTHPTRFPPIGCMPLVGINTKDLI